MLTRESGLYQKLLKKGANLVLLSAEDHKKAHEILFFLLGNIQDGKAANIIAKYSNSDSFSAEPKDESLLGLKNKLSVKMRESKSQMFDPAWQKEMSLRAAKKRRLEGAIRKGQEDLLFKKAIQPKILSPRFSGGRLLNAGKIVQKQVTYFCIFNPPPQSWTPNKNLRELLGKPPIGILASGFDLPSDLALVLDKYIPSKTWHDPKKAGSRISDLIRGKCHSYLFWSIIKIENPTHERQLLYKYSFLEKIYLEKHFVIENDKMPAERAKKSSLNTLVNAYRGIQKNQVFCWVFDPSSPRKPADLSLRKAPPVCVFISGLDGPQKVVDVLSKYLPSESWKKNLCTKIDWSCTSWKA